jgi:hypothetical protein
VLHCYDLWFKTNEIGYVDRNGAAFVEIADAHFCEIFTTHTTVLPG